jgi:endonuclease/exonuclease/phosphatase (EEP) superfamily protein YafD
LALRALLAAEQPDIVFLQEVNTGWATTLEAFAEYPYRHIVPRQDSFGIAMPSHITPERIETVASPPYELPALLASDVRLGAAIGSDHRPLLVTLQLTPTTSH